MAERKGRAFQSCGGGGQAGVGLGGESRMEDLIIPERGHQCFLGFNSNRSKHSSCNLLHSNL